MNLLRLLIMPLLAAALLLMASQVYPVAFVSAAQKEHSAHSKKPTEFQYVCPMHEDVTSRKPGLCRKCRMTLVKKAIKEPSASSN
jgi:Heavy metal binding domain